MKMAQLILRLHRMCPIRASTQRQQVDAKGLGLDQPTGAEKAKPEPSTSQRMEAAVLNMQICPAKGLQVRRERPSQGLSYSLQQFNSRLD